jgi:hypothetical protein
MFELYDIVTIICSASYYGNYNDHSYISIKGTIMNIRTRYENTINQYSQYKIKTDIDLGFKENDIKNYYEESCILYYPLDEKIENLKQLYTPINLSETCTAPEN